MTSLTDESILVSRQTSEEEASADQQSSNERPTPSIGERSVPLSITGQESQENIDEENIDEQLRNRQAAVVYVLGPDAEKLENFSSSTSDRLVVAPVDSEIGQLLTNEDLEKEESGEAACDSDEESDQINQKDALLSNMEEGQLDSAELEDKGYVPEDEESVVPPPPDLELQRHLHSAAAPGAFSVVPQEQDRFRDSSFRGNQNTGEEDVEGIASATPQGGVAEPQAVSATLVPSVRTEEAPPAPSNTTNEYEGGDITSSSEGWVAHVEGMSCWTFVKRNRKAQCGIVGAVLLFLLLVAGLLFVVTYNPADDDDNLLTLPPQDNTTVSSEDDIMSDAPTITPSPV